MRLLRIIGTTDPAMGGPWEAVLRSTPILAEMGHETEIVSLDPPDAPWNGRAGLTIHAIGRDLGRYRYAPRLVPWLRRNAGRFDAAIVHGIWNYASLGAWRALRGTSVPYFLFIHGMMDPWFRNAYPLKHVAKLIYWLALEGRTLRDARCVLFTSEEERRLAHDAFPWYSYRERVVAYGTADAVDNAADQIEAFYSAMPSVAGKPFLLFLGRLHPKKGCDLLLRGFAEVSALRPDLQLVMAGPDDAGWQADLKQLADSLGVRSRVHWPGLLTENRKWGALRAAEAFVLPSHQENFGVAVAEALACGRPVLITDRVNIWREIQSAGAGIVSHDDQKNLTRALADLVTLDQDRRTHMEQASRRAFLQHFTVQAAARDLVSVIEAFR